MPFTPEYAAAMDAHSNASASFRVIQKNYRLRLIGDAEYLAGRKAFDAAQAAFDVAYQAAQDSHPVNAE